MRAPRIRLFNTTPLAGSVARWIAGEAGLDPERRKAVAFGLDIVFSWLAGAAAVAAVSWALGCLAEGISALLMAFVLRGFSAGAHCSTSGRCALVTAMVYPLAGKVGAVLGDRALPWIVWVTYCASVGCVFFRARPRDPRDTRNLRFRPVAVLLLGAYCVLSIGAMTRDRPAVLVPERIVLAGALGCLWQSLTVTEPGRFLMGRVDAFLAGLGIE